MSQLELFKDEITTSMRVLITACSEFSGAVLARSICVNSAGCHTMILLWYRLKCFHLVAQGVANCQVEKASRDSLVVFNNDGSLIL